jgi:hypothetical protein
MNDLEAAHSLAPCRDTESPRQDETSASITVYSCRETEENYDGVVSREGDLRIVKLARCFEGCVTTEVHNSYGVCTAVAACAT